MGFRRSLRVGDMGRDNRVPETPWALENMVEAEVILSHPLGIWEKQG